MNFITQNCQKEVVLNTASFKDAMSLKKAAMKSILESNMRGGIDIADFKTAEISKILDIIAHAIVNADTSDEFEAAVFKCLERSHYDKKQINAQLFDDFPEAREDYYELIVKCCEVNLRPFFKSLVSELKTRLETMMKKDPEQKSQQTLSE